MSRLTRNAFLMGTARLAAQRSTCARSQVGTVISLGGRILMTGYNGAPADMPHCDHTCTCGMPHNFLNDDSPERLTCPALTPCLDAIHAEQNALNYCARQGIAVAGATLLTTLSPCRSCSLSIIAAGVETVIYDQLYRDDSGIKLLKNARVTVLEYR